jgi:hypothetical protein
MKTYAAAMFTRMVTVGEVNPTGEVSYDGYRRVPFLAGLWNLGDITFPKSGNDYLDEQGRFIPVICVAAMDKHNRVVGVAPVGSSGASTDDRSTTFDKWAVSYYGEHVDVPQSNRDAWDAAMIEAVGICEDYAKQIVDEEWVEFGSAAFVAALVGAVDECKRRIIATIEIRSIMNEKGEGGGSC